MQAPMPGQVMVLSKFWYF